MTGVDLHPEDLSERDARGELLPAEREHLERHLRQCKVCRFERLARADFQRESERLEEDLDVRRLLANVLAGGASPTPRAVKRRHRVGPREMLFGAAIAMIAGTAGATIVQFSGSNSLTIAHDADGTRGTVATTPEGTRFALSPAPVLAVDVDLSVPAPRPDPPRTPLAQVSSPPPPAPTAPVPSDAVTWERSAAAVFSRANNARRVGDGAHAESLYRLLIERHAATPEAHHALALLGQMLLDSGDCAAALHFFDEYLGEDGALREDVMLDRAAALQRLGRADEEAAAWAALLHAYPESVHAERARGRLSDLGKR